MNVNVYVCVDLYMNVYVIANMYMHAVVGVGVSVYV